MREAAGAAFAARSIAQMVCRVVMFSLGLKNLNVAG
jgi:hypothetical protein